MKEGRREERQEGEREKREKEREDRQSETIFDHSFVNDHDCNYSYSQRRYLTASDEQDSFMGTHTRTHTHTHTLSHTNE